jgi:hypothetical protein
VIENALVLFEAAVYVRHFTEKNHTGSLGEGRTLLAVLHRKSSCSLNQIRYQPHKSREGWRARGPYPGDREMR